MVSSCLATSKEVAVLLARFGLAQLNLNTVDTVDAINEQNENEDESDLFCSKHLRILSGWSGVFGVPLGHIATLLL